MTTPITPDSNRPLVTFYVMTYNGARFVREAVEAALAQTYTPTEILLSDDCSSDGTFEIIRDCVKDYAGPHKIVLNRNARTLGVSAHVNTVVALASGELIIASDGDDISHPERTSRCVETWLEHGKPAALMCGVSCIDAAGNASTARKGSDWIAQFLPRENESRAARLLRFSAEGSPRLISCAAAYTKSLYETFGPMPPDVWFEDDVITLRAWLFDRIVFIPDVLVSYREHDANMFNRVQPPLTTVRERERAEQMTNIDAQRRRTSLLRYIPDLDLALRQQWITRPQYDAIKRQVATRCAIHRAIENWWTIAWPMRVASFAFLLWRGGTDYLRWGSARLLPFAVFLSLGAAWSALRAGWRTSQWLLRERVFR